MSSSGGTVAAGADHAPATGSKISTAVTSCGPLSSPWPLSTSTRPSAIVTQVGYQRPPAIGGAGRQRSARQSKIMAELLPVKCPTWACWAAASPS
ncbi:hypothetical protein [Actinoplanes sp. NPDC049599]|uniref:hypothetical protein n=1 Tax=Actinoplanes sp. NPDC049599 TaxID=3363903 RepID=UPI0037ADD8A1